MNSTLIKNSVRFVALVLLQVVVLNNINFLGYINPYLYILFIFFYPLKPNRGLFLLAAFLLGLTIDFFTDSGGINAAASVTAAYIRPVILRFAFGISYELQGVKLQNVSPIQRFTYLSLLILAHHFILFSLDFFSFTHILSIVKRTLFSGGFTLVLCLIVIPLFSPRK